MIYAKQSLFILFHLFHSEEQYGDASKISKEGCTRGDDSTPSTSNLEIKTDDKDTDNHPSFDTTMMHCTRDDDDISPTNVMDISDVSFTINSTKPRTHASDVNVSIQDTCSSQGEGGTEEEITSIVAKETPIPNSSTSPNSIMVKGRSVFHKPGMYGAVNNNKLLAGKKFLVGGEFGEVEFSENKGDTTVIHMIQLFGGEIISCFTDQMSIFEVTDYPGKKSNGCHWFTSWYHV